jgi:YD repeat-containing protein
MTDPRGNTTQYTYDALGQLTQTTSADNSTNSAQYDSNGNVTTRNDEQGRVTSGVIHNYRYI